MDSTELNPPATSINLSAPEAAEPVAAPIRLWLVDDNEGLRTVLADLLAQHNGIECTRSFGSASAALSALASQAGPDVVLLDINIGKENGLDAVRPIRSLSPSTRVLMFTTFFDSQAKTRALADGASGFLLKNYSVEQILASIREAKSNPEPPLRRRRHSRTAVSKPATAGQSRNRVNHHSKSWLERLWNIWN